VLALDFEVTGDWLEQIPRVSEAEARGMTNQESSQSPAASCQRKQVPPLRRRDGGSGRDDGLKTSGRVSRRKGSFDSGGAAPPPLRMTGRYKLAARGMTGREAKADPSVAAATSWWQHRGPNEVSADLV